MAANAVAALEPETVFTIPGDLLHHVYVTYMHEYDGPQQAEQRLVVKVAGEPGFMEVWEFEDEKIKVLS